MSKQIEEKQKLRIKKKIKIYKCEQWIALMAEAVPYKQKRETTTTTMEKNGEFA